MVIVQAEFESSYSYSQANSAKNLVFLTNTNRLNIFKAIRCAAKLNLV